MKTNSAHLRHKGDKDRGEPWAGAVGLGGPGGGGHGLITTRVFSLSCCFLCVAAVSSGLLGRCGRGLVALIQWKGGP